MSEARDAQSLFPEPMLCSYDAILGNSNGWASCETMWFWLTRFFSSRAHHVHAFEEVFVVSVVSIVPLGLLPFIASKKSDAEAPFNLQNAIWTAISSGQLFLYSFAMLGMIIWLSVEDVSSKPFPPRKYFILVAILAAFLCLLVYESDPGLSKPLNPVVVKSQHLDLWRLSYDVLRASCFQDGSRPVSRRDRRC